MRKFMKVSLAVGAGAFVLGCAGLHAAKAADSRTLRDSMRGSMKGRRPKLTARRRLKRAMATRRRPRPFLMPFRRRLPIMDMVRPMWSCRDPITQAGRIGVVIRPITPMAMATGATATAAGKWRHITRGHHSPETRSRNSPRNAARPTERAATI